MAIFRDAQLTLALQRLEEEEVQNLEKKERIIMRDGEFVTMMQQKEEDEAQKSMEKEQRAMASTPTGKALILFQCVLSVYHFLNDYIPQNLGVVLKVRTLEMESMFFFADFYSIYKRYLEFPGKCHCGCRVALHKLVIATDDLNQ